MGMRKLAAIAEALHAGGLAADTPACAIQNGTRDSQRAVISTLSNLPQAVAEAKLGSPAIVVIGEVVNLAEVAEQAEALSMRA